MNNMLKRVFGLNGKIYYQMLPFLILYILICLTFNKNELVGDESRYLSYANMLLKGRYSPPFPQFDLWSGRGYSALLAFFLFFKSPILILKFLNAFLLY